MSSAGLVGEFHGRIFFIRVAYFRLGLSRCLALCDDCRENLASRSSSAKHKCPCCRQKCVFFLSGCKSCLPVGYYKCGGVFQDFRSVVLTRSQNWTRL
jgi:hypothetical protein